MSHHKENGMKGGRPSRLTVCRDESGGYYAEFKAGKEEHAWIDPKPSYVGSGWWLFSHPKGLRWIVPMGEGKNPGKWVGRSVAKGKSPVDVLRLMAGPKGRKTDLPDYGRIESPYGVVYFPKHLERGSDPETGLALNAFAPVEKREWVDAGWSLEKERNASGCIPIMETVEFELGETWGAIARAWVKRGRGTPALWGEGRKVWIRERLRLEAEKALEGFEV